MSRLWSLITLLVVVSACSEPPNGPSSPYPQPAVPASPSTPTPPAAPSAPGADLRRSFIWSEKEGFTILQNPPGVILVGADAINDAGDVTGTVILQAGSAGPHYRAFKWSRSNGFSYAPDSETSSSSYATGIDADGNVVGFTEIPKEVFVWKASGQLYRPSIYLPFLQTLGIMAGGIFGNQLTPRTNGGSFAAPFRLDLASGRVEVLSTLRDGGGVLGVNSRGDAVGYDGDVNYGFGGTSDAVIWDRLGKPRSVFACKGEDDCFASLNAVNADGLAVGSVTRGELGAVRVFRWTPDGGVEFLEVPQERGGSSILSLADDGSILVSNGQLGFILRSSGEVTTISPPPSHELVRPRAMNNRGQVVGMLF